jgi:ATP-dependent RNA helicase DDX24/MAK5
MSSERKKRARPVPLKSQRSKKRQKVAYTVNTDAKSRKVSLDELKWKEVELPEMFDDAEGFYGLEEVDDVEVVRYEGTIEYRVCYPQESCRP